MVWYFVKHGNNFIYPLYALRGTMNVLWGDVSVCTVA